MVHQVTGAHWALGPPKGLDCRLTAGPPRCVAGDFFTDPLPEADLYVLARVLHDWSHEKCVQLLARVQQACRPGGRSLQAGWAEPAGGWAEPAALVGGACKPGGRSLQARWAERRGPGPAVLRVHPRRP